MKSIKSAWNYFKNSYYKKTIILATFYSFIYRVEIKLIKPKKLEKHWGKRDEQTPLEPISNQDFYTARCIKYAVERTCNHTPWESKCLVRALTAQKLLKRKKIASTMYLGCGMENGKMVAHAWIRVSDYYITGGNGEGYTVVSTFRA